MAINIDWECNLDYDISECLPTYSFRRLDVKDAKIAKGWNFRYKFYDCKSIKEMYIVIFNMFENNFECEIL